MDDKKKESDSIILYGFISSILIIIILGSTYFFLKDNLKDRGTFGDMFGFANSLFTGFSFVVLIVTILLQRRDFKTQQSLLNIQAFESTFFNLIHRHHEIVLNSEKAITNRIRRGEEETVTETRKKGTDVFQTIYTTLVHAIKHHDGFSDKVNAMVYKGYWDILGYYYRSIELIVKLVDESESLSEKDKIKYIDIIKAQLSEYETVMIFYHFLAEKNRSYKLLAEKYTFFEFINPELVTDDIYAYEDSARYK